MSELENERRCRQVSVGHGEKRSRKRTVAIGCLLSFPTIKAAAKAAGIAEVTLGRWLKDPQFSSDYKRARERVVEMAAEQLRTGTLQAVAVLREVMGDSKAPAASRVQAARSFLECTSLLKGIGVSVTVNNTIPTDVEGINVAILESLRRFLASDPSLRESVRGMLAEIDREEHEETRPLLQ